MEQVKQEPKPELVLQNEVFYVSLHFVIMKAGFDEQRSCVFWRLLLKVQLTQRLYLQGLKPVGSAVNVKLGSMANTDDDDDNDEADNINEVKKP